MQIEDISRISLTSRCSFQKQGKCTICSCMLTQIIVYNKDIFAIFHPLLTDCTACIWCDVLQWRKLTGSRCNYGRICHSSVFFQCLYNRCNGGSFLSDCDINSLHTLSLLVDNGIHSNRCLSCLTVSDDQLSLSTSNRHHGIDCLDTCLQWCIYGFS